MQFLFNLAAMLLLAYCLNMFKNNKNNHWVFRAIYKHSEVPAQLTTYV